MLPKMNDKFAAFIEPALQKRGGLRLALSLICIIVFYGALFWLSLVALTFVETTQTGLDYSTAFRILVLGLADPNTPLEMIYVLCTFLAMFLAIWLVVRIFRRKGLWSLIGPGPVLRNFGIAVLIMLPIISISTGFGLISGDAHQNLPFPAWLLWMLPALLLLLIQVSAEELIFRGFLMQELAARFKARWIWLLLPSVIFGFLHYDPMRFGSNALLIVAITTFFGIIAADVTVRTGNLGAAIGLHFMNNLQAMMLLSLDGTLNGLSLYVTNTHVSDESALRAALLTSLLSIFVIYVIYLFIMRRRAAALLQSNAAPFT
jgi:membrane protease YdiL (CAAX protease family)